MADQDRGQAFPAPAKKIPSWLNNKSWSSPQGGHNPPSSLPGSGEAPSGSPPVTSPRTHPAGATSSTGSSTASSKFTLSNGSPGEEDQSSPGSGHVGPGGGGGSGSSKNPPPAAGEGDAAKVPSSARWSDPLPSPHSKAPPGSQGAPPGNRTGSVGTPSAYQPKTGDPSFQNATALLAAATAGDHIRSVPVAGGAATPVASPAALLGPPTVVEPFTLATASAADHAYEKRINRFYAEISGAKVNLAELRRLASHGIPNEGSLRSVTWKLLLGYLPVVRDDWDAELAKKRAQYAHFVSDLLLNPTDVERRKSRESRKSHRLAVVERWDSVVSTDSIQHGKITPKAAAAAAAAAAGAGAADSDGDDGAEAADVGGELVLEDEEDGELPGAAGGDAVVAGLGELRVEDHPLSSSPSSMWHQFFQDSEIAEQIERDIRRTHPEMPFFMKDEEDFTPAQEAMRRLLLVFAKLNPGIRYVQGMNEVLAPIVFVFMNDPESDARENAEADAFFCFVEVLSDFRDFFCQQLDNSSVGIRSAIAQLSNLLRTHDEELWRNLLIICKVDPQYYAFRWITLLLTQEFGFPQILRIWDAILSGPEGPMEILLRICCAMMICIRDLLLAGDFTTNLKLLQKYPPSNVERILQTADRLRSPR